MAENIPNLVGFELKVVEEVIRIFRVPDIVFIYLLGLYGEFINAIDNALQHTLKETVLLFYRWVGVSVAFVVLRGCHV